MKRAAGYVRTRRFEEPRPDISPGAQRARIERYIQGQGWQQAGWWEDFGAEARIDRTSALNDLLGDLAGVDKVVIASLDRLGLTARRLAHLLERLREANVGLVAIDEAFDSAALSGDALLACLGLLAQGEAQRQALPPGGWQLDDVRALGPGIRTVIDVGAADGTPLLYDAYPDAALVLIEPLADFEPELAELTRGRGSYLLTAVGGRSGSVTINVPDLRLMSSILSPEKPLAGTESREVPMSTLDGLFEEGGWTPPFGL
jgi:FkbM family methyltransferase